LNGMLIASTDQSGTHAQSRPHGDSSRMNGEGKEACDTFQ
jgi:hypothetical protein